MKGTISASTLLFILVFNVTYSQVTQQWAARYDGNYSNGNRYDNAAGIAVDTAGNVYVTGSSLMNAGGFNYATLKYNSAGVQQWLTVYDGSGGTDGPTAIALDAAGNIYVTGGSAGNGTNIDYATVKYNPAGVQQWAQRYNGAGNGYDKADAMAVDQQGNIYITGHSASVNGDYDYVTIKYNTNGVQQWISTYSGPGIGDDVPNSLVLDASGFCYVTGYSTGSGTGHDFATVKYSPWGQQIWAVRYDGDSSGTDEARSVAVDNSGNVFVTGLSRGVGTGYDFATVKYNPKGIQQWVRRYTSAGYGNDYAYIVKVDQSGNCYVAGTDYSVVKYSSDGTQQWAHVFGSGPALAMTIDREGNGYISGQYYAIFKFDPAGNNIWTSYFTYSSGSVVGIATDYNENVYITGTAWTTSTNPDYWTVKYSQLTGIHPVSNEVPARYSLSQNYPNPFNPSTRIQFSIPPSKGDRGMTSVQLKIYDALGNEAFTLVNENLSPGTYEVNWNADKFASGVYYYRLTSGDFTETKKMILLK